jgi:hypothetical protein
MKDVNQVESPLASLATWREENSFHAKSPRLYVLTGHEPQASSSTQWAPRPENTAGMVLIRI